MTEPLTVHALEPGGEPAWQAFLGASTNATLFHDLDFLAYHPAGKLSFHHLVVRSGGDVVAVVPGGLDEIAGGGVTWRSPVGASIGGPVLVPRPHLGDVLAVIEALQQHARACGWARLEITLPPASYHSTLGDVVSFALFRQGFRERQRSLCSMIDLSAVPAGMSSAAALFAKRQKEALRAAARRGAVAIETGIDGLDEFGRVFHDTYARHGARPTHTLDEIATLLLRFPDRVRLSVVREGGEVTAGLLTLQLTPTVTAAASLCRSADRLKASGPIVAIATVLDQLRERGCRWFDLGPSATESRLNAGAVFFKEGLGCVGYSRSLWCWSCPR